MDTHPCDCIEHCYSEVLLLFRGRGGADERTMRALVKAIGSGPLVGPFLYGAISAITAAND